ncbi:MAG: amidase [Alphaproteobacteria bacterium]
MAADQPESVEPQSRSFLAETENFRNGGGSPRDFLERCIATIEALEPRIGAFVSLDIEGARKAADAAGERWKAGKMLSPVDGMPLGVKDIMETAALPTEQGSPLFEGWRGGRDSAAVAALREAGAIIIGKTVTTEFAATQPRGTRNPWDLRRTPGGSSSGSVAAVAAGMIPAALGSQGLGSTIRPSSFCGVFGFKPSLGALNRGGSFDYVSQSVSSVLAATLEEAWIVARAISARVGGDPGFAGLMGPIAAPAASKPACLALLETGGWKSASAEAKQALVEVRGRLDTAGIKIIDRTADDAVAAVEDAIADAATVTRGLNTWDSRWPLNTYVRDMDASKLSQYARDRQITADQMTQQDYQGLVAKRQSARETYAPLADRCDACVTLSATGAAPLGLESTGDAAFAVPTSLLGTPAVSLPVLQAEGLPLGLQLIGFTDEDAALFETAAAVVSLFEE